MEEYFNYLVSRDWLMIQIYSSVVYLLINIIFVFIFHSDRFVSYGLFLLVIFASSTPFTAIGEPHYWWYVSTYLFAWSVLYIVDMFIFDYAIRNKEGTIIFIAPLYALAPFLVISIVANLIFY